MQETKVIDLTRSIDGNTPVYPGDPKPKVEQIATIDKDGWNEKQLTITLHIGTHIDAPAHMIENGKTLDMFPPEHFIGTGFVIDTRNKTKIPEQMRKINKGDMVFFYTCNRKRRGQGVIERNTAEKLISKRIRMFGTDSPSPDEHPFEIHKLFLRNDILIIENAVNLEYLIGKRFECIVLPLKIKNADGAPCRIIARIEDK